MDNGKSKENRRARGRRRNSKKEENREFEQTTGESPMWSDSVMDNEDTVGAGTVEKEMSPKLGNGDESKPMFSLMSPTLRRQLQTHKNILRLLHENNLVSTQINGQRILSIQPIRWSGPSPGIDCEIFVGRIPKTIYEDTLYPLFKVVGEIFQIRLMVDMAELTRGYCFIMYTNPEDAAKAITQLDQHEILPGKKIRVLASVNKCKLYVGPLPWYITSEEVVRVIYASAWDIEYVSIYRFLNHEAAYAIVSFKSHRNAALARRKLRPERLFKCNEVHVEWARVDWNPTNVLLSIVTFYVTLSSLAKMSVQTVVQASVLHVVSRLISIPSYEDRGTVDGNGDVQITRTDLQFTNTTYSSAPKSVLPICPPDDNVVTSNSPLKNAQGLSGTRYSNMLTMSASLYESPLDPCDVKSDASALANKMRSSHGRCSPNAKDEVHEKEEEEEEEMLHVKSLDKDSFRNFDMWNSSVVPQLSGSSASATVNLKNSELPRRVSGTPLEYDNAGGGHAALNAFPRTQQQQQHTRDTSALNYQKYCHSFSNERVGYTWPMVADVPCQLPFYQNYPGAQYFMSQTLASSRRFLEDAAAYNQLFFNYLSNFAQMGAPSAAAYLGNQSQRGGGPALATDRPFTPTKKKSDRKLRSSKTSMTAEHHDATPSCSGNNIPLSKMPDTPKRAQRHMSRVLSENNALSPVDTTSDERRRRPIVKQTLDRTPL